MGRVEEHYWLPFGESHTVPREEEIERFRTLILEAKEAKAYPSQSGFHVLAAALTEDGRVVTGGNKEYAFSDAFVHGETAVISHVMDECGDVGIKAIAFYSAGEITQGSSACPCGNCRDVMRQYCSPDMVLLEGNEHHAVMSRFGDYLFEDYHAADPEKVGWVGVNGALRALGESITVYLPENLKRRVYGVALVAQNDQIWRGSLYTNAGYDAVTPALSAVQSWRNTLPLIGRENHLRLDSIVVAGNEGIPDVLYRDRQALLELDEALMLHTGRKTPLPVFLIHMGAQGELIEAKGTDTKEWLPHPFSPVSFGMDDALKAQVMLFLGRTST